MTKIEYQPIGIVHSPFTRPSGMPIQPAVATGVTGTVELFEEYWEGLKGLEEFSRIILLCHLHRGKGFSLSVVPSMDSRPRGVFATRAPRRPNPIGLSVVRLTRIEEGLLHIENIDVIDGTPLLDIKPYCPELDAPERIQDR